MTRANAWVAGGLWLVLAGFLSFTIDRQLHSSQEAFDLQDTLSRFLGSAKEAVGDALFLKADSYYHGGSEMHYEETHEELEKEGAVEHEEEEHARAEEASSDWIAGVNHKIRSYEHTHLARTDQKEMLPFLALATSLDPHNVEAILTTAYWLDVHMGKTDAAIETLRKGGKSNPDAWEIDDGLAKIYFKKKDYRMAEQFYLTAIQKAGRKGADEETLGHLQASLRRTRELSS